MYHRSCVIQLPQERMKCPLCQETIPQTFMESIQNNTLPPLRLYAANSSAPLQRAFNNAHEILLKKNKILLEKESSSKRKLEEVEKEHDSKVNYFDISIILF